MMRPNIDPLTLFTDDELYAPHTNCPLTPTTTQYLAIATTAEELEADLPICCQRIPRQFQKPVTEVARVINKAGIGCVLWNGCMFSVYGLENVACYVDFVVDDELIDLAADVICASPPPSFGDVVRCTSEHVDLCQLPRVAKYYHDTKYNKEHGLQYREPYLHIHTSVLDVIIRLWKQSTTLWAMPPLTELPVPQAGSQCNVGSLALSLAPDYTVASHPRFTKFQSKRQLLNSEKLGRYPADLHPVVVLTPERGFETAMRIYARHSHIESDSGLLMRVMSWFHELKVGNEDVVCVDRIIPQLRVIVKIALQGDITSRELRVVLREILGEPAHDDGDMFCLFDNILLRDDVAWQVDRYDPELSKKLYGQLYNVMKVHKPKQRNEKELRIVVNKDRK